MKELSIEQKAKAYDNVREKIAIRFGSKVAKEIFSEYEEPEDERIRKWLIHYFKEVCDNVSEKEKKGILFWLEKQGETFTKKDVDDAYLKGVTDTKNEMEKQYEANYQIRKDIATFIFNYRGELKDRAKWMDYLGIKVSFAEKQGEQKPADKVEPKFDVGDWVIGRATHNEPRQIAEITEDGYKSTYGGWYGFSFENDMHLWTIEDAKDGDVLCTYECGKPKIVFILNGTPKKHYALCYYCYYNIMYPLFESDSEKGCLAPNDKDVLPATKEQRDLLFQKMKEAGYEWDAEKKELRNIEQKLALTIPKFKIGDKIQYLKGCGTIMTIEKIKNGEYIFSDNMGHTTIESGNKWYLVEQNLTDNIELSEFKDKLLELFQRFRWYCKDKTPTNGDIIEYVDAHIQELIDTKLWSEEDEKLFEYALNMIEWYSGVDEDKSRPVSNWLKSLKDRIFPQNPTVTDEELAQAKKDAYNNALDKIEYHSGEPTFDDGWSAAIWYLKKRNAQPRNTWKPNKEQITWLYRAADDASKDSRMKQVLNELLSDLKKLRDE